MEWRCVSSGRWLRLMKAEWSDESGKVRSWEMVKRVESRGAAMIVATLKSSGRFVLARQFRPPVGGFSVEFPAGLVDEGETPERTAVRELREETGYTGEVVNTRPTAFSSPGMTSETVTLVEMVVDDEASENAFLETDFDDGEHVETIFAPRDGLLDFLNTRMSIGDAVDAKLLSFAVALEFSRKESVGVSKFGGGA